MSPGWGTFPRRILFSVSALIFLFLPLIVHAATVEKRVLVLHSYHPGMVWTDNINAAISKEFAKHGETLHLHIEYLDTKRYHDSQYLSEIIYDVLQHKLSRIQFDLIILSDNDALNFALRHRDDLLAHVPMVFCGVNNYQPKALKTFSGITGVAEIVTPRETIDLALRLHPGTKEIVGINSTRDVTGREMRQLFLEGMSEFKGRARLIMWDDLPLKELQARLKNLRKGSLVFLNGIIAEKDGGILSYIEGLQRIYPSSPVPLYSYWDFLLDRGIVGGKLVSGARQGQLAAHLTLRILGGENPDDLEVIHSGANVFMFDNKELRRFGVPLSALPVSSTVINRPPSFYRINKKQLWSGLGIMGGLFGITGVLTMNILSRRRAESLLRESQRKFRGVFDQSFQFFGLMKPDGTLLEINRTACEFLQVEPGEIVGQPFWNMPWWSRSAEFQKRLRGAVQEAARGRCVRFEMAHQHSEGKTSYFDFSLKPVTDEAGEVVLLIPEARDITEHIQVENELRQAHRRLQDIIEFLPDATFVIDQDKKVIAWNRAIEEMTGVFKQEILGQDDYAYALAFYDERRPVLIDMVEESIPRLREHYETAGFEGGVKYVEQFLPSFRGDQGMYFWATASALYDDEGQLIAAIESIRDITERKRAEEALRAANRELDAFVYTVSHDLRSPLTLILGYTQVLKESYKDQLDLPGMQMLSEIEATGKRMIDLMEDLLVLAKVGNVERPTQSVDVGQVVHAVVESQASRLLEAGIEVCWSNLPSIKVPKTLLAQIFDNLIGNAVLYAGCEGGPIEIGAEQIGEQVRIFVRDHGPGISMEERNRIFEVFYRGATGREVHGTGIGLATVRKIARHFGGDAWVEETPGGGATFWIELAGEAQGGLGVAQNQHALFI